LSGPLSGLREQFTGVVRSKSRSEWCDLLEEADVCFAAVLTLSEAAEHPHNVHRATFVEAHGYIQPAPVPRSSRTPGGLETPPSYPGEHSDEVLEAGPAFRRQRSTA
jgi:alpha-methylacyl-CoA racemase